MFKKINLDKLKSEYIGKKINMFTILDVTRKIENQKIYFSVRCECGKEKNIRKSHLLCKSHPTKSCGCTVQESINKIRKGNKWNVKEEGVAALNKIIRNYTNGAIARGLDFELTKEQFKNITQLDCSYCGSPPSRESKTSGGSYFYNGIDRLDNSIGYIFDNCVPCCTRCNFFKGSLDSDIFLEMAQKIYQNNTISNGIKESKLNSYYQKALAASIDSPDEQTKVGAILVNKKSGAIIASGYNGFVRGADDINLPKTRPEKYQYIVHAEQNLIFNCAAHGISTADCAIFVTLSPCVGCTRAMYQSGIRTVYFKDTYRDFEQNKNMGDLILKVTKIGDFTKIDLRPKKNFLED